MKGRREGFFHGGSCILDGFEAQTLALSCHDLEEIIGAIFLLAMMIVSFVGVLSRMLHGAEQVLSDDDR